MKVTLRLLADRRLTRLVPDFVAGRYRLTGLPSADRQRQEFILTFEDTYFKRHGHAYPEKEGEFISELMALMYDAHVDVIAYSTGDVDCSDMMRRPEEEENLYETENVETDMERCLFGLVRCEETITKQFIRSMHAYSLALRRIYINVALAFVLLVTAIEALSSRPEIIPAANANEKDAQKAERFCRFIQKYCAETLLLKGLSETTVTEDLKTIYYVSRSGFLHGGAETSLGVTAADRSGARSFPVIINNKEKVIPGLQWFRKAVRSSLLGFAKQFPDPGAQPDQDVIARIASERGVMQISGARFDLGPQKKALREGEGKGRLANWRDTIQD